MRNSGMICRTSTTFGIEPIMRPQSTGSIWMPEPNEGSRPKMSRAHNTTNGTTFALVVALPETAVVKPSEATLRVLSEIKEVATTKSMRTAVRTVFSRMLELLDAGDERAVDELLAWVSPEEFPVEVSLAFLSITVTARAKLAARVGLRNRIRDQLVARRGEADAARLLAGL